MLITNTHLINI